MVRTKIITTCHPLPTPKRTPKTHGRWNHEYTPENTVSGETPSDCERDRAALCNGAWRSTWVPGVDVEVSLLAVGQHRLPLAVWRVMILSL